MKWEDDVQEKWSIDPDDDWDEDDGWDDDDSDWDDEE